MGVVSSCKLREKEAGRSWLSSPRAGPLRPSSCWSQLDHSGGRGWARAGQPRKVWLGSLQLGAPGAEIVKLPSVQLLPPDWLALLRGGPGCCLGGTLHPSSSVGESPPTPGSVPSAGRCHPGGPFVPQLDGAAISLPRHYPTSLEIQDALLVPVGCHQHHTRCSPFLFLLA